MVFFRIIILSWQLIHNSKNDLDIFQFLNYFNSLNLLFLYLLLRNFTNWLLIMAHYFKIPAIHIILFLLFTHLQAYM